MCKDCASLALMGHMWGGGGVAFQGNPGEGGSDLCLLFETLYLQPLIRSDSVWEQRRNSEKNNLLLERTSFPNPHSPRGLATSSQY